MIIREDSLLRQTLVPLQATSNTGGSVDKALEAGQDRTIGTATFHSICTRIAVLASLKYMIAAPFRLFKGEVD